MSQADPVTRDARAAITGAAAGPSVNPVRAAHTAFFATLAVHLSRLIPVGATADDLQDRADHIQTVLIALWRYLAVILQDTAENALGGLDLRQIDALLADLVSEVNGTLEHAVELLAGRIA
jgi:hypothetical protein